MKNQRSKLLFPQIFILLFFFPGVSFSENVSGSFRDELIQEKLDCVNQTEESQWEQLCFLSEESPQKNRQDIIEQALDSAASNAPLNQKTEDPDQDFVSSGSEVTPLSEQKRTEEEVREQPSGIQLKTHDVEFGTEVYRYSYKEPIFNLETKGLQYGILGAYVYRPPEEDALRSDVLNMYKIDARFASGPVDYSSDGSGQLKDEDNYVFEVRGIAGYDHLANEQFLLTGYAGLGFRYLNNDSGGRQSTTGAYGYERVSNYFYLPVGVEALNQITPHWKIASNLEWDIFLFGEQTSYLSDVNSGYPDPENNQNRGYGIRGSTRIIMEGERANLFFEPFFRYWRIHDSEVTTAVGNDYVVTGLEPDNNTTEYGVKLGLQY